MSDFDAKIVRLNAYKALLTRRPSLKNIPDELHDEITKDYEDWVQSRIGAVFSGQSASGFTAEETTALKALAAQVMARQAAVQPAVPAAPIPQRQPLKEPLKEATNVTNLSREQKMLLKELEDMERKGPQF